MAKVINEALSSSVDDLLPIIQNIKRLSNFWPSVKPILYWEPGLVSDSSAASKLLSFALENEPTIDLSPFKLSESQARQILLEGPIKSDSVTAMSLSGNLSIQEELMREIPNVYSNVGHLQLLNAPQLSLDIKLNLVRGAQITEMLTTELLLHPFSAESVESGIGFPSLFHS